MSNQCDLQAVSIDPMKPTIKVGQQTTVKLFLKNNGPGIIAKGEATCHITVDGKFLNKPAGVKAIRKAWTLDGPVITKDGRYEIYLTNKAGDISVNEPELQGVSFTVRGKKGGKGFITVVSSLSGSAQSSDVDGSNQSVSTEIIIK